MSCTAKHASIQFDDADFNCPKCGAKSGDFFIEEPAGGEGCDLLHQDDYLVCALCGYGTTGGQYARAEMRRRSMVQCPHCKGTGMVPKKKST